MESERVIKDGTQCWFLVGSTYTDDNGDTDGIYHRSDGPAIIWGDGSEFWYLHNKCHREDGPACYYTEDNTIHWFFNGGLLLFKDWCIKAKKTDEEIVFLKLKYAIT